MLHVCDVSKRTLEATHLLMDDENPYDGGAAFSADGKRILLTTAEHVGVGSGGEWWTVVWAFDTETGKLVSKLEGRKQGGSPPNDGIPIEFSPAGERFCFGQDVYDANSGERIKTVLGRLPVGTENDPLHWGARTFTPDGQSLLIFHVTRKHSLFVCQCPINSMNADLDFRLFKIEDKYYDPDAYIGGMEISPDGRYMAVAEGEVIRLWDFRERKLLANLVGHSNHVTTLAFSSKGTMLASSSQDATTRVWDISSVTAPKKP